MRETRQSSKPKFIQSEAKAVSQKLWQGSKKSKRKRLIQSDAEAGLPKIGFGEQEEEEDKREYDDEYALDMGRKAISPMTKVHSHQISGPTQKLHAPMAPVKQRSDRKPQSGVHTENNSVQNEYG